MSRLALFLAASLLTVSAAMLWTSASAAAEPPAASPAPSDQAGLALFRDHVREVLAQNCVRCHGGEKTNGEFDITTREGLLKGGEQGPAIVPGKASGSLLVKLITHADEPFMPDKAPQLPAESIAKIAAWIDAGAPYDKPLEAASGPAVPKPIAAERRAFWSFQPLAHPPLPAVSDAAWCRNDIDRFVLARLDAARLKPNGPAERRALIRRASFDLLGLPPTPEEIDAFVNDSNPDAYARLIDRLLASPHYGERWGRHWLDLARFAESHGYEQDYDRPNAWHYRDFVIRALNDDMPYDQFIRWQLAGDELAPENPQAWMATGFLAAGTHATQITANQAEKERYDELDDMAATIGTAMLGLTVGCARCHDHKFDPIGQYDYYRMLANFTTTVRSDYDFDLDPAATRKAKEAFDAEHAPLAAALANFEKTELPARFDAWLRANPAPPQPDWLILEFDAAKSSGGARLDRQPDGSYLAHGAPNPSEVYTFSTKTTLPVVAAVRIEALADDSLPKRGPGRAESGNFALTNLRLEILAPGSDKPYKLPLQSPRATFEENQMPAAAVIDDDPKTGWSIAPQVGYDQAAAFEVVSNGVYEPGSELTVTLKFESKKHAIGRVRVSISSSYDPPPLAGLGMTMSKVAALTSALAATDAQRTPQQRTDLLAWYRGGDAEWLRLNKIVDEHQKKQPKPQLTKALICSEGVPAVRLHTQGPDFYEQTFFLKRGDLAQKQAPAAPGYLRVLETSPSEESRWQQQPLPSSRTSGSRAALARWLTDADEGAGRLLARVIVNRMWQHHFGRGIVATPSDFGTQGERPTHPELLDWLAGELLRSGWQLKPLHRLMMSSAAYTQEPAIDPQRSRQDPDNKLLWHYARHRLEAESLRDAMLAVSGQLDRQLFGAGTLDEKSRRRTVYFTIKRSKLIPWMVNFDCPEPLQGVGLRSTTTVAPQALALMNNQTVLDCAAAFAKQLEAVAGSADFRVSRGYVMALGRPPDAEELKDSLEFLEQQTASYQSAGKGGTSAALALTDFCQALLSLNEFAYVD